MTESDFAFLQELIATPSPSGYEQPVQSLVRRELEGVAERFEGDLLGSLAAYRGGCGEAPLRVMVSAHCDEIGFLVKYIDERGFLFFAPLGGVDPHLVPGQRVRIHTAAGPLAGVVGKKPIHLLEAKDRERVVPFTEQFIDIGCSSGDEARRLVAIGDPVTFAAGLERLQGDRVTGRGFDDRIGVFIVTRVLQAVARRGRTGAEVVGVTTVQEELGLRGAQPGTFAVAPDLALVVEIGHASDTPANDPKVVGDVRVGGGPVLSRGPNINPALFELLVATARDEAIPVQIIGEQRATSTDANVIQLSRGGVATALVRVATRYVHTPAEVLSLADVDGAIRLLTAVLFRIGERQDFLPV
jgi:putative aminopeptidase FrvX